MFITDIQFSSVQLLSHVWLFATPWIAACQASLSITNSRSLLKLMSIELMMPSHPPRNPSQHQGLSNESTLCMRWPKDWTFSFSISPFNEHAGLISFRMDLLYLLAVQGTLKNLLQHHSSKASILWHSAFFTVQLSHPYMTTGKTIALTKRTCVGNVMSLLFNMLSRLVITFLPRSQCLLISWLQSPSAVILEPPKIKSATVSTVSPSIFHEVMGPFCFIDYAKAFHCVDHNKLWKILKKMGIPDHPTCLLRNLYSGQEATVRTGHGTTDWIQIRKGVHQGCILSPCLFNLYAEYIMRNAGLEETQLESRILGEISITSDMQMTPPLWRGPKKPLDESERGEWKSWLKG